MRHPSLTRAIALALLAAGHATATASEATPRAADAPLDVRYLRQSEIARAVVSSGNDPSRWRTPVHLRGRDLAEAAHDVDPLVAWIPSGSLATEAARSEAARIVHTGVPVLVTHRGTGENYDARTFGVEAPGAVVLYRQAPRGVTYVVTSGDMRPGELSAATIHGMFERSPDAPMQTGPSESTSDPEAPVKKYVVEAFSDAGTGAHVSMHITVARDFTMSHDKKKIVVVTQASVKPFQSGVSDFEWPMTARTGKAPAPFRRNGTGYVINAVGKYHLETAIAWPAGADPKVLATEEFKPAATGTTEHNFQDSFTDSTSYSLGVSAELAAALGEKDVKPSGKLPVNFAFQKQRTEQHGVTVVVKDYSIAVGKHDYPEQHARSIRWTYPMDSRFATNPAYFSKEKNSTRVHTTPMTPMMREAHLETVSGWTVDGKYEGEIIVGAAAQVENNVYLGKGLHALFHLPYMVYNRKDLRGGIDSCAKLTPMHDILGCRQQPVATVKIDLGSPYLTRAPTVLLQSFEVNDGCLTQASPAGGELTLASCDITESNRKQQWVIDEEGRYVNRASKMCLEASNSGTAVAATCSQAFAQKWAWKADRLHSQQDEYRSRLHVVGDSVRASFDASRHQDLPVNTANALLLPWNTYPRKPVSGSYVPGFTAKAEPVPEAYLSLRQVDKGERWKTIVLRTGLIR